MEKKKMDVQEYRNALNHVEEKIKEHGLEIRYSCESAKKKQVTGCELLKGGVFVSFGMSIKNEEDSPHKCIGRYYALTRAYHAYLEREKTPVQKLCENWLLEMGVKTIPSFKNGKAPNRNHIPMIMKEIKHFRRSFLTQ